MNFDFDVYSCIQRLKPYIIETPLVEVEALSAATGKRIYLKLESMQRTGAFKFRGAMNYMLSLQPGAGETGVITASSGNHGLGMSLAGKIRGIRCTVVMPVSAPQVKQNRAKQYGAEVILSGYDYDEAQVYAKALAENRGYTYVPSFNHPAIIEGQGTILKEIADTLPEAEVILAPVGGGGLISGLLLAAQQLGVGTSIVGVEPVGAASMAASLAAGQLFTLKEMDTIADGVAVRTPGEYNYDIVSHFKPDMVQVTDADIKDAQKFLLHESKLLVETAGAVPVAALLTQLAQIPAQSIVCVISGANFDVGSLKAMI